jgi:hypothetical protein
MLEFSRRRAAQCIMAGIVACSLHAAANAATINIILSDMDVSYAGNSNGGVFFDSMGGVMGGGLNPLLADELSTAVFELDNAVVGTVLDTNDPLHGDLRIINIGATITKNILNPALGNNGGGFGFDFFTDSGFQLQVGLTNVSVLVTNGVFFFTGEGSILPGQNLPFGLILDESQPVQISYTATLPAVQAGPTTNAAISSGALTISGIAIPEPTTNLLLVSGLGALGFVLYRRRRTMALAPVRA